MKYYRIVKKHRYWIQERFFFFLWLSMYTADHGFDTEEEALAKLATIVKPSVSARKPEVCRVFAVDKGKITDVTLTRTSDTI